MKKFQAFFKQIVAKIEDYPLPLKRYLLLFLAILAIRLCLEFFANNRLFRFEDVLHIGLWFIFIVGAFMLQLHAFSKVKIEQIVKLVVCCFSIALTAPIIDLLISQGKFSKMNYLSINSYADIAWSYVTIGGASLNRGATIGIRIEIVLLVLASFNYIYLKTRSVLRTIIGTLSIYTVLFLSGTIPFFMGKINELLHLTYSTNDQSSVYLLFTLDLLIFLIIAYRYNRKLIPFAFSTLSFVRTISALSLVVIGAYLARKNYPTNWLLDPTTLYYFPLLVILLALLFAYEKYGRSNQHLSDQFTIQNGILLLLFCTSACISFYTSFAVMLSWSLLFILYEKPLLFSSIPVLAALFRSFLMVTYLFIGYLTFGAPMVGIDSFVLFLTLIVSFSINLGYHYLNQYIYKNKTTQGL